ncbi:hypothetical protein niasHS_012823 [Heterodera schachtii]|uniref:Uncharacterized protein n=1 Tax=Heterodera schachtii TaxID=97005 RepID=A0ABD2I9F7_HETSC
MEPLMEHKVCGTTIPKCGEHLRQRPQHICVPSTRILIRGVEFEQLRVRHCSVTRGSSGPASPGYSLAVPMQPEQAHLNPQGQREKGPHPHQTDYLAGLKHRCDTRRAMTETGFRSVTAAALDTSGISPVDSERPCPPLWEIHPITSYVDLSKVFVCTEFKLKKVADDGVVVDVPANAAVGLIQMPGATFIRNLKVHINQREVYDSNQLYSYKVFLDTELSYPVAAKEAYFGVAGYFRDSDPTKVNDKRKKAVEESKSFQTISKLSADIFNQDLYMISNVEIDIELALQSDDFMIHQEAANRDKYTLEVVDCRLIVKTVDLMDGLSLDIAKKLDLEPARYGIRKTLMKSLFITGGRYDFSANLFTEEVPRRVIIGLVPNQNYIGQNQKNPFYFNHHNVRDIELTASGRTYPQFPYNLDYKNNRYARAYHDTQEAPWHGLHNGEQRDQLQHDSPGFELIKEGCTAVNIRFAEAVPNEGVTLIAYADMSGENYSSDFVQMPSSDAVHEGIVLCFPDVIEKSPINFFLCLIYLFGAAGTAVAGFYLFLRERRIRRRNGQSVHRQSSL